MKVDLLLKQPYQRGFSYHPVEVVPGWWLGTNYSRRNIQEIIGLALEVAGQQLRNTVKISIL